MSTINFCRVNKVFDSKFPKSYEVQLKKVRGYNSWNILTHDQDEHISLNRLRYNQNNENLVKPNPSMRIINGKPIPSLTCSCQHLSTFADKTSKIIWILPVIFLTVHLHLIKSLMKCNILQTFKTEVSTHLVALHQFLNMKLFHQCNSVADALFCTGHLLIHCTKGSLQPLKETFKYLQFLNKTMNCTIMTLHAW